MKVKRFIALLVSAVMLMSVLAACGGNDAPAAPTTPAAPAQEAPAAEAPAAESTGTPEGDARRALADQYGLPHSGMEEMEPITFTYFNAGAPENISRDNPFSRIVQEITGVTIEIEYLVGDAQEKYGVMIASGDMPDMVNVGVGEVTRFIEAGSYIPLQDLVLQYAPNYRQVFDRYWPGMFTADGNKYVLSIWGAPVGIQNPIQYNGSAFWIQKDVLDHFGRAPSTVDEYFDMIREYKDLHPTIDGVPTIGYEINMSDGWRYWALLNSPKSLAGYANWGDFAVADTVNHVAIDSFSQPWSRTFIEKLNEEFLAGTIVAETLTRDYDQYLGVLATGAVLGMYDQLWSFQRAQELLTTEGRFERTYLPVALTYDASITPNYMDAGVFTANNGIGITVNCADPVRLMMFVNWMLNEEVQRFLSWGIEGEHYYVNENGRYVRFDEQRRLQDDDPQWVRDNMGHWLRNAFPKIDGSFSDGNAASPGLQDEEYFASLNDYDKGLFERLGILSRIAFMGEPVYQPSYFPFWDKGLTSGDTVAGQTITRVTELSTQSLSRIVLAPEGQFESMWNAYQEEIQAIDQQPMWDAINEEIQRWRDIFGD